MSPSRSPHGRRALSVQPLQSPVDRSPRSLALAPGAKALSWRRPVYPHHGLGELARSPFLGRLSALGVLGPLKVPVFPKTPGVVRRCLPKNLLPRGRGGQDRG